jgi:hypothetical protein
MVLAKHRRLTELNPMSRSAGRRARRRARLDGSNYLGIGMVMAGQRVWVCVASYVGNARTCRRSGSPAVAFRPGDRGSGG